MLAKISRIKVAFFAWPDVVCLLFFEHLSVALEPVVAAVTHQPTDDLDIAVMSRSLLYICEVMGFRRVWNSK